MAIGRLGTFELEEGRYAYVGSAMNGLQARTARHLEARGKMRWHIDHLMRVAEEREALLVMSDVDIECSLAERIRSMPGASEPIPGFGSSDCRCRSHLFLIDDAAYQELKGRSEPSPFPLSRLLPSDW